ncbi:hypothetical protein MHU86_366 [Fragilaria crotonensis]|nr:hypothetical protein MHU86_366 [Fragilaria crotonensis]
MVRHKTRWLLVRFEFEGQLSTGPTLTKRGDDLPALQTKEIYKELVKTLSGCFGMFAHAIIPSLVVRHVDDESQLCMIRVPRDGVNHVRTAITFMTTLYNKEIVASVLSVNGSARTARLAIMQEIRKRVNTKALSTKDVKQLDARLQVIREIDG